MTEKERKELINLRKRVEAQRDEIKRLRRLLSVYEEKGGKCGDPKD